MKVTVFVMNNTQGRTESKSTKSCCACQRRGINWVVVVGSWKKSGLEINLRVISVWMVKSG